MWAGWPRLPWLVAAGAAAATATALPPLGRLLKAAGATRTTAPISIGLDHSRGAGPRSREAGEQAVVVPVGTAAVPTHPTPQDPSLAPGDAVAAGLVAWAVAGAEAPAGTASAAMTEEAGHAPPAGAGAVVVIAEDSLYAGMG